MTKRSKNPWLYILPSEIALLLILLILTPKFSNQKTWYSPVVGIGFNLVLVGLPLSTGLLFLQSVRVCRDRKMFLMNNCRNADKEWINRLSIWEFSHLPISKLTCFLKDHKSYEEVMSRSYSVIEFLPENLRTSITNIN